MKQSLRALVLLVAFCFITPVYAGILFGNPDLNSDDVLLFTVEHTVPGAVPYSSLFSVQLKNGTAAAFPSILTCFPEQMELVSSGTVLRIRNRYGTAEYSLVSSSLVWKNLLSEIPLYSYRQLPVSVSPDGKWQCFIRKNGTATGFLVLVNTATGEQLLLSSGTAVDYTAVPVKWSPDSSTVFYDKEGIVYFCRPDAAFKKLQSGEEFRKIGKGTVNSVQMGRSDAFTFIDGDIVYRLNVSELNTLGLYGAFVASGTAAGRLPYTFNPKTDTCWTNDDASELALIGNGRMVSYFKLPPYFSYVQTVYSRPFTDQAYTVTGISVIWPHVGLPVVRADMLSASDGKPVVELYRLDAGLQKTVSVQKPACSAVSPDGRKIAVSTGSQTAVYDTLSGKQLSLLSGEQFVSLVWKDNDVLFAGGDQTVREWNTADNTQRVLFLSSAKKGTWNHRSAAILAKTVSAVYVYDSAKNTWAAASDQNVQENAEVQNGRYRVYTGTTRNQLYDNAMYIRTLAGKAVTRPLIAESIQPAAPLKKAAVVFDAVDCADGLSRILSILDRYNLTCTFFINGDFIRRYPQNTKQIALSGNECASMFYTSADLTTRKYIVNEEYIRRGLARNEDEFYDCTGKELALLWHAPLYRSTSDIEKAGTAAGYHYVGTGVKQFDTLTLEEAVCGMQKYYTAGELIDGYMKFLGNTEEAGGRVIPVSVGVSHGMRADYLYDRLELFINTILDAGYDIVPASKL